ncbi:MULTISPECIES: hypothetical protein [Rhodopseudomonas]|uniref:hypothetical protein n=1 Tax=Rhodopseudomonas TaxID=1073 RepID=UPI0005CA3817|nr:MULTISPECIES: hypothetical protein [Rhodopseudomonas]MDF3808797.1 hypothetical protein [Rhodopseudomonas sp. BAL398]WOK20621.1 hypothetical protein RBJ75_06520 [Rhodopseudomonas sp. BAL398]
MRFRVRKAAHLLERSGLAMAGAASGMFVGAHVGSSIHWLTSWGFLLAMMAGGAIGFYLGIDIPRLDFRSRAGGGDALGRIDTAEFLSAVGTFLASLTAFVAVGVVVLRSEPYLLWTAMIMLGWLAGIAMQIGAGIIARRALKRGLRYRPTMLTE